MEKKPDVISKYKLMNAMDAIPGQGNRSTFRLPQLFKTILMAQRWLKNAQQELSKSFEEREWSWQQNLILDSWQNSWSDRRPIVICAKDSQRKTWPWLFAEVEMTHLLHCCF
eukprot:Skav201103  [mRNA]  locus=scaffold497:98694:99040:- [translate_table: standard]